MNGYRHWVELRYWRFTAAIESLFMSRINKEWIMDIFEWIVVGFLALIAVELMSISGALIGQRQDNELSTGQLLDRLDRLEEGITTQSNSIIMFLEDMHR